MATTAASTNEDILIKALEVVLVSAIEYDSYAFRKCFFEACCEARTETPAPVGDRRYPVDAALRLMHTKLDASKWNRIVIGLHNYRHEQPPPSRLPQPTQPTEEPLAVVEAPAGEDPPLVSEELPQPPAETMLAIEEAPSSDEPAIEEPLPLPPITMANALDYPPPRLGKERGAGEPGDADHARTPCLRTA